MSKYNPLKFYLLNTKEDEIILSFTDIEKILNCELPQTAYKRRQWWENNICRHTQANAWLDARWEVDEADLQRRTVRFLKLN